MNPYYHQTPTINQLRQFSGVSTSCSGHGAYRGWICNPMMVGWSTGTPNYAVFNPQPPVEYVDQVVILNTPFIYGHVYPLVTVTVDPDQQSLETFLHTFGIFYDPGPVHPFEAYLESNLLRIEQEESVVLEEAVNSSTSSGSGLAEETITRHLQASAAQEKSGRNRQGEDQESDICAICLDEYDEYKKMGRLECGHGYHAKCIKTWLLRKNVCPMCKATAITV